MSKSFGVILLAIWLILTGILQLTNITFVAAAIILGCLAIGAGVCLLLGK